MIAAERGHLECLQILNEVGHADLHKTTGAYPHCAMHAALGRGHSHIVKYLIGQGCSVHDCGSISPPIVAAAEEGTLANVEALIEAGADPNRADGRGKSAISYAAEEGHDMVLKVS